MQFDWSTFALQTVNFAILVWLLHRFLYKPVLRMVDLRRAEIDKRYAEASAAEAAANDRLAAIEAERAGIAGERAAALKEAAEAADAAAVERRAQAERDAAALLADVRKNLAVERGEALAEMRRAAFDLGAEMSTRLIADMPDRLRTEAWLDRIEERLAAMPPTEKERLSRQLIDGARVEIVTASALPADAAEAWRARLERSLGTSIAVDFDTDPKLVAGAELHFPNAVLRFSWQDTLAAMRAQIASDGDAR